MSGQFNDIKSEVACIVGGAFAGFFFYNIFFVDSEKKKAYESG
jgi:hypothetical protein